MYRCIAKHTVFFRCERPRECRELVCGLKLYEKRDEDLFADLISSIKEVQDAGGRVKLSVGGFKYGNIKVPTKVKERLQKRNSLRAFYLLAYSLLLFASVCMSTASQAKNSTGISKH